MAEAHGVAATANAELDEMRIEQRQMTSAESPATRMATSVTAAAQESNATRATTLLKVCKAELDAYSMRPRRSESDQCSGAATTAAEAAAALEECRKTTAEHELLVRSMKEEHVLAIATMQSRCAEEVERQTARTSECHQELRGEAATAQAARKDAEAARITLEQLQARFDAGGAGTPLKALWVTIQDLARKLANEREDSLRQLNDMSAAPPGEG